MRGGGASENNAPVGLKDVLHSQKPKFRFSKIFIPKFWQKIKVQTPLTVFSPFTLHVSLHKSAAFTLAEVLITLGIIGIVAAMTLPSLLNKAEKLILKNQFKKSYSTLSQALLKSEADFGAKPACYYRSRSNSSTSLLGLSESGGETVECPYFKKIWLKNLNVIQTCKDHAYPNCIPKYKGFDTMIADKNPDMTPEEAKQANAGIALFNQSNILNSNSAYVLADGSIIIDYQIPKLFAIDINGKKGPNKWGYDLFAFFTGSNETSNLILLGTSYNVEDGGMTTIQMLKSVFEK